LARAVKREPKWYFFDWAQCTDPGARFENYLAVQLLAATTAWREQGFGRYELAFLRDQDRREIDFVITKDLRPVALIEAKHTQSPWPASLGYYCQKFKVPGYLVWQTGGTQRYAQGFGLSSARFLWELVATH
jgi:uncharacterized protein